MGVPPAADSYTSAQPTMGRALKRLGGNSAVYFLGEALQKGAWVLLLPLYTRAMDPKDFGILAVVTAATWIVTIVMSFGLENAIGRFVLETKTDEERARLYGTVMAVLLTAPLALMVAIELAGRAGYLDFIKSVPYNPYLRFAFVTGYLSIFMAVPVAMFQAQQKARRVTALRWVSTIVSMGLGVILVVGLHQGVLGVLRAALAAAAVTAVISLVVMARVAARAFDRRLLIGALMFGLPVIPHLLSHWLLNLSDRIVLEGFVSDSQLGLYSLGYTVGLIAALFTNGFSNAALPVVVRQLNDPRTKDGVPRLGTYSLAALSAVCVALAVLGGPAIYIVMPPEYHGAAAIVPWVAGSYVCVSMYLIVSQGSWYAMRTGSIALATIFAGVVNVLVTIALAGTLGILGAAVATLIGYALLALIQGLVAYRVHPIPWEYRRWAVLAVVAAACIGLGALVPDNPTVLNLAADGFLALVAFPLALWVIRFFTRDERQALGKRLTPLLARVSPGHSRALPSSDGS
jgi:O-antigen/teichoic acid export membrane protein